MDPMVSARVPAELRDQVNDELRNIGSSPTELINKAYEFFLNTKTLPDTGKRLASGHRKLNDAQIKELKLSLEESSAKVPESYFRGKTYDDLLANKLKESYEALA